MSNGRSTKEFSVSKKHEVVQAYLKGLKAEEVSSIYGVSQNSVMRWARQYDTNGLSGLESKRCGPKPKTISPKTEAAEKVISSLTSDGQQSGIGKVQGVLYRHGLIDLARETVRRLLKRRADVIVPRRLRTRNKPKSVRSFERANPNDLWQTDIMTFMIKGQYRAYLIGFMDDNSRYIVGWGLYRFQTTANVQEAFRAAIEKHGLPKEVLSDNGRQYYTWRGKSKFTETLTKLGIRHVRSRPYHPQTLGKIESFWRNVIQECLSMTPIASFEEAQNKIREYIEYYNFKRPHQGIGNLIPSDRYFNVADQVKQLVESNTQKLEESISPVNEYTKPVYLVGNLGGQEIRLIAKDAKLSVENKVQEKVELEGNTDKPNFITERKDVETTTQEIAKPAGTVGPDNAGYSESKTSEGTVPSSGSIPRIVLPVDEKVKEQGAGSAGIEAAGAETEVESQPGTGIKEVAETITRVEEETSEGVPGERTPCVSGADSKTDNQASLLGRTAGQI